eukprot:g622.t1
MTFRVYPTFNCKNKIPFGFVKVLDVSYTSMMTSVAVSGQIFVFLLLSSFGDYGSHRKNLLLIFAWITTFSVYAMGFLQRSEDYYLIAISYIIGIITLGASIIMYNAYLPWLVKDHPKVRAMIKGKKPAQEILDQYKDIQESMSTWGFFWGYVTTVAGCIVAAGMIIMLGSTPVTINYICLFIATFMASMNIWCMQALHPRPGPPAPGDGGVFRIMYISFSRLYTSLGSAYMLPESWKFMLAYFMYSDGYSTFTNVGVLIASTLFDVGMTELLLMATLIPLGGAIGMFTFYKLQKRYKLPAKSMLLGELGYFIILPLWCLLGFLQLGFGLDTSKDRSASLELYTFCLLLGLCLGSIQSYSRTTFIHVIPPGQESEFFGLYEITDKGSSWLGPFVVAVIYNTTGEIRFTVFYIAAINFLAFFVLLGVDFNKATRDCNSLKMAMRIKRIKNARKALASRRGNRTFLSLNSLSSAIKSAGSSIARTGSSAASSIQSSGASSTGSSVASSNASSITSSNASSAASSNASDYVESAMSEIEDMDEDTQEEMIKALEESIEEMDDDDPRARQTLEKLNEMKEKMSKSESKRSMGSKDDLEKKE